MESGYQSISHSKENCSNFLKSNSFAWSHYSSSFLDYHLAISRKCRRRTTSNFGRFRWNRCKRTVYHSSNRRPWLVPSRGLIWGPSSGARLRGTCFVISLNSSTASSAPTSGTAGLNWRTGGPCLERNETARCRQTWWRDRCPSPPSATPYRHRNDSIASPHVSFLAAWHASEPLGGPQGSRTPWYHSGVYPWVRVNWEQRPDYLSSDDFCWRCCGRRTKMASRPPRSKSSDSASVTP